MNRRISLFLVVAVCIFSVAANAHHSFAMFDHEKTITVTGTVKEFEYTNPHCWIHVSVADPSTGKTTEWAFEMGSVGQIAADGWKADTIKPGDKITIEAHPMKDGTRGGQYQAAKLADGRTMKQTPQAQRNQAR